MYYVYMCVYIYAYTHAHTNTGSHSQDSQPLRKVYVLKKLTNI